MQPLPCATLQGGGREVKIIEQLKINNMEQKQSYLSTVVKGDMNLYEVRIFMLIVEQAQAVIEGEKLKDIIGKAFSSDHLNINFSVEMKRLVANRHHYDDVLDACERLSKRFVKVRDEQGKRCMMTPFLYNIILEEGSGILRFSVAHWLVDYILDFTRGVCRYDLQVALSFRSAYVARMYMLCAGQIKKFPVSVAFLKSFLGVEDKYKQTAMFLRRCIDPAVKEIEARNVSGFIYEPIKGQRGKVEKLMIIPVKRGQEKERRILGQGNLSAFAPSIMTQYLSMTCGFSSRELSANKETLGAFAKKQDWQGALSRIAGCARAKENPKRYIIGAMKKEIQK